MAQGVSTFQHVFLLSGISTDLCCTVCGAYHFCSTPCMRMLPTFPCPLASDCLTWAALSQPQSCFGPSTRNDVSSLWLRGAMAPCFSPLDCSVLSWRPIHPGQLEPTTLPLRRLAPASPSHSLLLSLLYPTLSLSPLCCSSTLSVSLSLSLSLSLPLAQKKGVRVVWCISIPPPGFEPSSTGQKRCGVSTGPRRLGICTMRSNFPLLCVIPCHAYLLSHGGVFSSV